MNLSIDSLSQNQVSVEEFVKCHIISLIFSARIGYCIFLVIVCILICFRLLQASDQLQELKSRDASRLQIIPKSNKGYLIYIESRSQENIESWTRLINNDLEGK